MMKGRLKLYITFAGLLCFATMNAQQNKANDKSDKVRSEKKVHKAWELGLGGSMINWNRMQVNSFQSIENGYKYNLRVNHLIGGANLYVARELNKWFYLDLQGTLGLYKDNPDVSNKTKTIVLAGPGIQFRLSPLFKSQYVEPFIRVGINYMHKDFNALSAGSFINDPTGEAHWETTDTWNNSGSSKDKNTAFPVSLGAGVNAWLSNSLGLGLQGNYYMATQKNLPNFTGLTLRVIWRIGGKSKKPAPIHEVVTVERPVEKIVERIVEKHDTIYNEKTLSEMLNNVHFDFDKATITAESSRVLDEASHILKGMHGAHFLITGYTDACGSDAYNMDLSRRRAKAIVDALEKRGVPESMLKSRGVGKRIAAMPASEANYVRIGDRKVTIEKILKNDYWNRLPKSN